MRRIANGRHFDDKIDVVSLDLPRNAWERHEVIGHHDNAIGVYRVGQRETKRAASRAAVRTVGVAEAISGRGGNDGDVDMHFAVLDCLPAASMRAQHAETAHLPLRTVIAEWAVHAAFNMMNHAGVHQFNDRGVAWERGAGKPPQILYSQAASRLQGFQRNAIAIAEVMMR